MPRGKKNQFALAESGDGGLAPIRVGGDSGGVPDVPRVPYSEARAEEASLRFSQLLARTDGWLRVIPCGDGKLNYFKFKFSSGQHKGKYVMFVGSYTDWIASILGLYEKCEEVDRGVRVPALDTFYDPR